MCVRVPQNAKHLIYDRVNTVCVYYSASCITHMHTHNAQTVVRVPYLGAVSNKDCNWNFVSLLVTICT